METVNWIPKFKDCLRTFVIKMILESLGIQKNKKFWKEKCLVYFAVFWDFKWIG